MGKSCNSGSCRWRWGCITDVGGVITTTLGNLVTEALDGHRDAEHMLASIANGLILRFLELEQENWQPKLEVELLLRS